MKNRFFTVLLVFLLLAAPGGPLGVRPAQAAFVPLVAGIAVGGLIAAAGVMVAGAGVYKPPTFAQSNAAVDQITGDITRKVEVARMFGQGVTAGLRGFESSYTLDFAAAKQWVKDHSASYPSLYPAYSASDVSSGFSAAVPGWNGASFNGSTIANPLDSSQHLLLSSAIASQSILYGFTMALARSTCSSPWVSLGGDQFMLVSSPYVYLRWFVDESPNVHQYQVLYIYSVTAKPVDLFIPVVSTPSAFAAAYPNTQAGHDETDKIAADCPAAIKSAPLPMTADQISEAAQQASAALAQQAALDAQTALAADPTNTALQVAAAQAVQAAQQAATQADAAKAEAETKPEVTDTPPAAISPPAAHVALDFTPFNALSGLAATHYPFNILNAMGSYFSCLVADPAPPSFMMPTVFGHTCSFDLSAWSTTAGVMRAAMLFFFNAACMGAIVRRWS